MTCVRVRGKCEQNLEHDVLREGGGAMYTEDGQEGLMHSITKILGVTNGGVGANLCRIMAAVSRLTESLRLCLFLFTSQIGDMRLESGKL